MYLTSCSTKPEYSTYDSSVRLMTKRDEIRDAKFSVKCHVFIALQMSWYVCQYCRRYYILDLLEASGATSRLFHNRKAVQISNGYIIIQEVTLFIIMLQ